MIGSGIAAQHLSPGNTGLQLTENAAATAAGLYAIILMFSSTSFANPAITIGRMFSNTFAGIAPSSAPVFIAAQIGGGAAAVLLISKVLYPALTPAQAGTAVVPHETGEVASADGNPRLAGGITQ